MYQFHPKQQQSLALQIHALQNFSNYHKVLSAFLGGAQSVISNKNTVLLIENETAITKTVDPWAGSYYVESLTAEIAEKAWALIEEVEALGGMTKAIDAGIPKLRIEEAAARKQARIDSTQDIIVGVNKYRLEKEDPLQILDVDNQKVRLSQIERLNKIKLTRDSVKVKSSLLKLTKSAQSGEKNLLDLAIEPNNLNRATPPSGKILNFICVNFFLLLVVKK